MDEVNWEKLLRNRWSWVILFIALYFLVVIYLKDPGDSIFEIFNDFPALILLAPLGLLYWVTLIWSKEVSDVISIVLVPALWFLFIVYFIQIKKIGKSFFMKIALIWLLIFLLTAVGCTQINYGF